MKLTTISDDEFARFDSDGKLGMGTAIHQLRMFIFMTPQLKA
jgi:hypothetical protein